MRYATWKMFIKTTYGSLLFYMQELSIRAGTQLILHRKRYSESPLAEFKNTMMNDVLNLSISLCRIPTKSSILFLNCMKPRLLKLGHDTYNNKYIVENRNKIRTVLIKY
jgi:hypothetical protein